MRSRDKKNDKIDTSYSARLSATQYLLDDAVLFYERRDYSKALGQILLYLKLEPNRVEALNIAGACARCLGNHKESEAYFHQAISLKPDYADAHSNLGNLLRDLQRFPEAEASYCRAVALYPNHPDAYYHLGTLYHLQVRNAEAEAAYRQSLAVLPNNADALYNLGLLLQKSRRYTEATEAYQRMLVLRPDYADAHTNLGNMHAECGRNADAVTAYSRALEIVPDNPDLHYNLGTIYEKLKMYSEAGAAYQTALRLQQDHGPARWKLAHMLSYLCDWHSSEGSASAADLIASIPDQGTVSPFEILANPDITALQQYQISKTIAQRRGYGASVMERFDPLLRSNSDLLRIGYLSADFYDHATTRLLTGVLEQHDRSRFAVFAYAYGPVIDDPARKRVVHACECFRDLSTFSDQAAAGQITADGIDILLDLKGFTAGSRLGITAFRPAPLIVSWLGYPGTLGEPNLADYIIGDQVVTPLEHAAHFSETLALLPHSYQPNDRCRALGAPFSRDAVGLPEYGFVFCNFNQSYKLNPATFDVWCRLLRAVPDSVLWLLEPTAIAKINLRREAEARGVAAARLIFAPVVDPTTHLQRLQCADLVLDTFPYGSHTTGSDALWAGVPLITHMGETFASRVAGSLLHAVGLPELVTQTWDEYFDLARELAIDRERLAAVQVRLAGRRLTAPLFDTVRFTRDLERLYSQMWQDYREGKREPIVLTDKPLPKVTAKNSPSLTHIHVLNMTPPATLAELLRASRLTAVVDIGANPIDGDPPYKKMLAARLCTVIGFEPQEEALVELVRRKGDHEQYLSYTVGDGQPHTLNLCRASGMTSLLKPDPTTLNLFEALRPLGEVIRQVPVQTRRLDDIAEIGHLDFLKIDVQGGELAVFQNGEKKLAETVVIQTEISFVPLYQDQAVLGDIDLQLRRQGFLPHGFVAIKKWPIAPAVINNDPTRSLNQLLEADLVYVRDFSRPELMSDEQLKHLALITHFCYGSFDLALRCVMLLEQRGVLPTGTQQTYLELLTKACGS